MSISGGWKWVVLESVLFTVSLLCNMKIERALAQKCNWGGWMLYNTQSTLANLFIWTEIKNLEQTVPAFRLSQIISSGTFSVFLYFPPRP